MPELPEVETVVRLLVPDVVGREVRAAEVGWAPTVGRGGATRFRKAVVGARVTRLWRRAKYLVFDLEREGAPAGVLLAHLRMSGRFHVEHGGRDPGPWCRLALQLDDGRWLRFVDPRKFGRVLHLERAEDGLPELGPEPLDPGFDGAALARGLAVRRRQLKPLLLDQAFVAGLGNIYVDESLFRARLHPCQSSERVRGAAAERLAQAIRSVLRDAIEREGASFDTFYRTPTGQPGSFQHQFQVYGRAGQPCKVCQTPIRRLVVGQRGTHVCPRCQPAPRRRP